MKKLFIALILGLLFVWVPSLILADDYIIGENSTIYAQIFYGNGTPANSASVNLTLWAANGSKVLDGVSMTYVTDSQGLYKYDFTCPNETGVYIADIVSISPDGYGSSDIHVSSPISANYTYTGNFTYTGANTSQIWGENITGYTDPTNFGGLLSDLGGANMRLVMLFIGVLAFMGLYVWKRQVWLAYFASAFWILWAFYSLSLSSTWDIAHPADFYGYFWWVGFAGALGCLIAGFTFRLEGEEEWREDEGELGQPIMVLYKNGKATSSIRELTDEELGEKERNRGTSRRVIRKRSKFNQTGKM